MLKPTHAKETSQMDKCFSAGIAHTKHALPIPFSLPCMPPNPEAQGVPPTLNKQLPAW